MGRQPPASERPQSQRAPREERVAERDQQAELRDLEAKIEVLTKDLADARNSRSYLERRVKELEKQLAEAEPPSPDGRRNTIAKFVSHTSSAFYEHSAFLHKILNRYESEDIAALWRRRG